MHQKIHKLKIFALLFFTAIPFLNLHALEVPALTGRVNDYAGMLSAETKNSLEAKLEQLEKSDSTQIVVLTVPSLEGDALEDFSIRVAEKWKIGQKKLDNGAILLIAKDDREIRIENGYGLEGKLTDLVSGRIIDNIITPNFRNGNYDAGVLEAVDAMISAVKGEFSSPAFKDKSGRAGKSIPGNSIFVLIFLIFVIGALGSVKRIFGGLLGAAIFPIAGLFLLPLSIWLLLLVPVGFLAGLILPVLFSLTGAGRGGGFHSGGGFGGFSGGGGGFSGGGGSFGGGGASGSW